jgi:hypothetical protein
MELQCVSLLGTNKAINERECIPSGSVLVGIRAETKQGSALYTCVFPKEPKAWAPFRESLTALLTIVIEPVRSAVALAHTTTLASSFPTLTFSTILYRENLPCSI